MKQKIILIIFIAFYINTINAQTSFKKTISIYDNQFGERIAEDDNGGYVFISRNKVNNNFCSGINKINKTGTFIKDTLLYKQAIFDIKYFNNYYYVIGDTCDTVFQMPPPYNTRVKLFKFDTNLNLISVKYLTYSSTRWVTRAKMFIDSDTNIVVYGENSYFSDTIYYSSTYDNLFFYKISLNGDSLCLKYLNTTTSVPVTGGMIEKSDKSGYYAFVEGFETLSTTPNKIIDFDKSFFVNSVKPLLDDHVKFSMRFSVVPVKNDTFMLVANSTDYEMLVTTFDSSNVNINCKSFGDIYAFQSYSLRKKDENYFLAGYIGDNYKIFKITSDLSIVWEKTTGDNIECEICTTILPTNDNGCILLGSKEDQLTQKNCVYIIKLAPDGTIQWENSIPVNTQINIYPNPGSNLINIQTDKAYNKFTMFDISGKQVLSQTGGKKTINTSNLPTGVYIYKLTGKNNKVIQTGKWVKQ